MAVSVNDIKRKFAEEAPIRQAAILALVKELEKYIDDSLKKRAYERPIRIYFKPGYYTSPLFEKAIQQIISLYSSIDKGWRVEPWTSSGSGYYLDFTIPEDSPNVSENSNNLSETSTPPFVTKLT